MKQATMFFRTLVLIALAVVVTLGLFLIGLLSYIFYSATHMQSWNVPVRAISDTLQADAAGNYAFTGQELLEQQSLWAMLVGPDGRVIWEESKPEEVPDAYTLNDVAAFTRWYLHDYPVHSHIRDDGLLVVGAPKNTTWKHTFELALGSMDLLFWGVPLLFLLSLSCVVWLCARILRRWFRTEQQKRDQARADWVSGVSHDIRTPLSMVMGYASELEQDAALSDAQRAKASILVRQSQRIKELVNDLNLTMRLDYAMQPLRKTEINPAALVRQVAADFLNSGLGAQFSLAVEIPPEVHTFAADAFLLRRALYNLVGNCIQHNPDGCAITLGICWTASGCTLWVSNDAPAAAPSEERGNPYGVEDDGGAAHGTGLRLVRQIARAHGGTAAFYLTGDTYRCEIRLPHA